MHGSGLRDRFESGLIIALTILLLFTTGHLSYQGISAAPTVGSAPSNYTLSWMGYDWDGAGEESLMLNGHFLASLPATDSPQNSGSYASFSLDISSLVVSSSNTLTLTHAGWDCGTTDSVKNLEIDSQTGVVFKSSTVDALSCTQSLTYKFSATTTSGSGGGSNAVYRMSWKGYDWDGTGEETISINSHFLTSLPATASPQNSAVYTSFSLDTTSQIVQGSNTVTFTHANWDCAVSDDVKGFQITNQTGVVFSSSTIDPLSCNQPLTYHFDTTSSGSSGGGGGGGGGNSSSVPILIGWGGVRLDEAAVGGGIHQPSGPTPSAIFPGESATNMELLLSELKPLGYNVVKVSFDPSCTGSQFMSTYSAMNLQRAIQIAQHFGFWMVVDYHGFTEPFTQSTSNCWLNFWSGVVSQFKNSYSKIIWEPEDEPKYGFSGSACSGASACVAYLSNQYQQWINQDRSLGDTHWIVVENICSFGCSLCPGGDGACSAAASGFPSVTDPLGTLSQGGRIFISLHTYIDYGSYSTSWNDATAESVAQQYYQAMLGGVSKTGWPILDTESGASPLCGSCAPDAVLTGNAGYSRVTFHFVQTLTSLLDSNTPQRINWINWPAGSWTDTPNAGIYGAMQCTSSPQGWGCSIQFKSS
jgi:hypothetical protein